MDETTQGWMQKNSFIKFIYLANKYNRMESTTITTPRGTKIINGFFVGRITKLFLHSKTKSIQTYRYGEKIVRGIKWYIHYSESVSMGSERIKKDLLKSKKMLCSPIIKVISYKEKKMSRMFYVN